jgi:tellurite resistance protein TerC
LGPYQPALWLGFAGLVAVLMAVDLGVLNRRAHTLGFTEALRWSGGVVALAVLFGGIVFWQEGSRAALEFYTGYLVEVSLSVDNLFVFILIFAYFGVPAEARPRCSSGESSARSCCASS